MNFYKDLKKVLDIIDFDDKSIIIIKKLMYYLENYNIKTILSKDLYYLNIGDKKGNIHTLTLNDETKEIKIKLENEQFMNVFEFLDTF